MEGPVVATPEKRVFHHLSTETNGTIPPNVRASPPPVATPPGSTCFRILCPVTKTGAVIGKSGSIVRQLQKQSGAKIQILEPIHGCQERVVRILASDRRDHSGPSSAQEALTLVFERIVTAENEGGQGGGPVICRLLVPQVHVGSVMGKGGRVVKGIRKESGAKIRVLTHDQAPPCVSASDELIQIMGDLSAVKKALLSVSTCLQESAQSDKARFEASGSVGSTFRPSFSNGHGESFSQWGPPHAKGSPSSGSSTEGPADYFVGGLLSSVKDGVASMGQRKPEQELVFRLLCSNDRRGGVIGRGGTIVKAMQNETGAAINFAQHMPESDECVVTISAMENPESRISPAQNAVIRVHSRVVEVGMGKGANAWDACMPARLLVPATQIGCLLGKGGTLIADMRRATGATIMIFSKDQVPKCASEDDEVVQAVEGDGNPKAIPDVGNGLTTLKGGLGSGTKSAIVTNTTIEIAVPEHLLGSVYGENRTNLNRIKQISGAKVTVYDPRPGTTQGTVIISGTPDQTQAAQSLLQAYILSGPASP
ncbi:KH domain-containing protein HEN4 isoform X3 [Amborella trichopoda]|uniref:KH domain-containing protein HEN4 isoform X3 n=1 Tax=Amborella trichopoda TaxID=13333 RepID=UPI0009C1890E|nr:KH domain-containing protein HEN4 isoform X3 [Amborella trichopoda]|eukprot:XP_020528047.1 KH domain-containing protein HEN4 isoform X3 [Amborella trichopoda]